MNNSTTAKECPKCESQELEKGQQFGYGGIGVAGKLLVKSAVDHIFCTDCGFVIETYVREPKKFKGTSRN
ncbi:transcription initiation factor TFIIIB [Priestia filamentosa]|uniref:transcription initiation factor TFIIIB n=1 Tax=Priestia filamentosa TaxID=1402861 RepID=UPI0039820A89